MELVMTDQRKKIHPHKFTLWIAIGSITMMFAGLTSAYIIKRNQPNWFEFNLPIIFWYSTAAIVISSVTMWLAVRAFREKEMAKYRRMLIVTFFLGIVFINSIQHAVRVVAVVDTIQRTRRCWCSSSRGCSIKCQSD